MTPTDKSIKIKNRYPELVEGSLEVIDLGHSELYALAHDDLLVVHNLSEESFDLDIDGEVIEILNSNSKQKGKEFKISPLSSIIIRQNID